MKSCQTYNREFATHQNLPKFYSSKVHKNKVDNQQNRDLKNILDDYDETFQNSTIETSKRIKQ